MKAKRVQDILLEFRRNEDPYATLDVGIPIYGDIKVLKEFAEKEGYDFKIEGKEPVIFGAIDVPLEGFENHSHDSYSRMPAKMKQDDYLWYNNPNIQGKFPFDTVKYRINRPTGWEDSGTPISVRKHWVYDGKIIKQALMKRCATVDDAIHQIKRSIKHMVKKYK